MADLINRTERDDDYKLLRKYSVNTPDYSTDDWIVNPDLSSVAGVPEYYWKASGDSIVEMESGEKTTADSTRLSNAKAARRAYLAERAYGVIEERYNGYKDLYQTLYSDSSKVKPKRNEQIQPWTDWVQSISENLNEKISDVESASTVTGVNAVVIDEASLIAEDPGVGITGVMGADDDLTLETFLDEMAQVEDPDSGIKGPFYLMQILQHRKDLYNDDENPLFETGHSAILGSSGILEDHADRVENLENIHGKLGYHQQEVFKGEYVRPLNVLFYYGYPNSYNSLVNGWDNEKVSQDMARYSIIVLGDGVQDPSHPDYSNTQVIIPRVKALNNAAKVFGYVSSDQSLANFQTKAGQWDTLEVDGVFLDESGYDFGRTRSDFNDRVDYVHGLTHASTAFANAWNTDHVLGTANDPSYPNSTYNSSGAESSLATTDWVLMESFPINTLAYSSSGGYESPTDWAARGSKMQSLRAQYGVNFCGLGVINNSDSDGQDLFDFGYISAVMWSLEAYGTSDVYYGASTAQVTMWPRPDVSAIGKLWNLNAAVTQDNGDTGIYHRYVDYGKLSLGWVAAGETGYISTW